MRVDETTWARQTNRVVAFLALAKRPKKTPRDAWTSLLLDWRLTDGKTQRVAAVLTGFFVCYLVGYVLWTAMRPFRFPFGDFFALWSYARFLETSTPTALYDPSTLHAFQVSLGMPAGYHNPFPYPPTFLPFLLPIIPFSYVQALIIGVGSTLLAYLGVARSWSGRPALLVAALIAPTSTITIIAGQTGFLFAALMFGGFRLLERRPVAAGIMLGLLGYKPQLAFLVPVALVAARQWRCLVSAAATIATLAGVVTLVSGVGPWLAWAHMLPAYQQSFDRFMAGRRDMPTVLANLQMLGVHGRPADLVQLAAALGAASLVWHVWSRGSRLRAVALMPPLTLLATPHAFVYDCPMLALSIVLLLEDCYNKSRLLRLPALAGCLAAILFPAVTIYGKVSVPISVPALLVFTSTMFSAFHQAPAWPDGTSTTPDKT